MKDIEWTWDLWFQFKTINDMLWNNNIYKDKDQ